MAVGRIIIGAVAGVIVAGVMIAVVEGMTHAAVSGDRAFGGAVLGYGLGALVGSATAARVSGRHASLAVLLILVGLAGINLLSFPHPGWFAPVATVALGRGWWVGSRAGARMRCGDGDTASSIR
jgi:hypothetical protein